MKGLIHCGKQWGAPTFSFIERGPLVPSQQNEAVFMEQALKHIQQYVLLSALIRRSKGHRQTRHSRCFNGNALHRHRGMYHVYNHAVEEFTDSSDLE